LKVIYKEENMIEKELRRYGRGLAAVAVVVAAIVIVRHVISVRSGREDEVLEEIRAAPIKEISVEAKKQYIGYVTPINEVDVYSYINGFVDEVLVKGGQSVRAGEELVKIKPEEYVAALNEALATEEKAEADFNYAQNYYERMKRAGTKAISQTELDSAEAKYLAAKGNLAQAKAAVERAKINFGYTTIRATINGVIGTVGLSVGDYVSPQKRLFNIVQTDPIRIVFAISDKDYLEENRHEEMFDGEKIKLVLADGNEYEHQGFFEYADNAMDRTTNAIAVYARFANPQEKLVDNAYVTVEVEKQYVGVAVAKDLVTLLPEGAEVNVVVEGDVVKPHITEILTEYEDKYILQNNFKSGDKLVLDKVTVAKEGRKMKVVEERK